MNESREILGQIKVVVELLDPFLKCFADPKGKEGQGFASYLLRYLNDLVADLTIPAKISLYVRLAETKNGFAVNSYQVVINDSKCRLPLPTIVAQDVQAQELAGSVARVIHQNRELIVTVPLSKKIWEKWSSENGGRYLPSLSVTGFHEFISALVRQGFKIERGKGAGQVFKEKDQTVWSAERIFEEAINGLDGIAIKIFLSKTQYLWMYGSKWGSKTQSAADDMPLEEMKDIMLDGLFYELGVFLPEVSIDIDESLEQNEFRIQLNDLRFPRLLGLERDQFLVNDTSERLSLLKLTGEKTVNPANGSECAVIRDRNDALETCKKAGLTAWGPMGFIILALSAEVRRNAGNFLTTEVVKFSLNRLREAFPDLVDSALKYFDIVALTRILRDLLDEELSIRDLRGILEALLAINRTSSIEQSKITVFSSHVLSFLRASLNRYISNKYMRNGNALVVYLLDKQIETRITQSQPLNDVEHDRLVMAIFDEFGSMAITAQTPIILTTLETRKRLRSLIEIEFPRVAVLCYQELSPDMNIQTIGRISCDWKNLLELRNKTGNLLMDVTAARYLEFMIHSFHNGLVTLQELEGMSDEEMETIYALGYNFFTYGKYEAAKDIFVSLTAYGPYTAHYWSALGAANQQMQDYAEAIAAYDMAIANDEKDVKSYVYRAESQILSGNVEAGIKDLEEVLMIAKKDPDPQFHPWVERCELLLSLHKQS
ncbi:MAG: SycD/LcrH family type III secretion system chaperone [Candidatus Hodarchaeota archaeon]